MYAIVDDDDYDSLIVYRWSFNGHCANSSFVINGRKITIGMHRIIMNAPNGMEVDHINGNPLDNRKCNLRICTHEQNSRNKKMHTNKNGQYKGTTPHGKHWRATIRHNKSDLHLGTFKTEIEAAKAYDTAARLYYGEFAQLNFPD